MDETLRPAMKESPERGKSITIDLKFQRHGLRDGLLLTDEGREITEELAQISGKRVSDAPGDYDAAKAIGSPAGTPPRHQKIPRLMADHLRQLQSLQTLLVVGNGCHA